MDWGTFPLDLDFERFWRRSVKRQARVGGVSEPNQNRDERVKEIGERSPNTWTNVANRTTNGLRMGYGWATDVLRMSYERLERLEQAGAAKVPPQLCVDWGTRRNLCIVSLSA